jgi:hypothetical protein
MICLFRLLSISKKSFRTERIHTVHVDSKIIAKKIAVSTSMYEKGKKIIKETNVLQKNSLRDGSASLVKVYNRIRKLAGVRFSFFVYSVSNLVNAIIYNIFKVNSII